MQIPFLIPSPKGSTDGTTLPAAPAEGLQVPEGDANFADLFAMSFTLPPQGSGSRQPPVLTVALGKLAEGESISITAPAGEDTDAPVIRLTPERVAEVMASTAEKHVDVEPVPTVQTRGADTAGADDPATIPSGKEVPLPITWELNKVAVKKIDLPTTAAQSKPEIKPITPQVSLKDAPPVPDAPRIDSAAVARVTSQNPVQMPRAEAAKPVVETGASTKPVAPEVLQVLKSMEDAVSARAVGQTAEVVTRPEAPGMPAPIPQSATNVGPKDPATIPIEARTVKAETMEPAVQRPAVAVEQPSHEAKPVARDGVMERVAPVDTARPTPVRAAPDAPIQVDRSVGTPAPIRTEQTGAPIAPRQSAVLSQERPLQRVDRAEELRAKREDMPLPDAPRPKLAEASRPKPVVREVTLAALAGAKEMPLRFDQEPHQITQWDLRPGTTSTNPVNLPTPIARAEMPMPPQVAQQLATAMARAPDKPVEIALNPPELGRVRLMLSTNEIGVTVQVIAERGDTLDMMRRHIGDLGQSLADLGYEDIAFAFGQGGDAADTGDENNKSEQGALRLDLDPGVTEDTETTNPAPLAHASTGIDVRL